MGRTLFHSGFSQKTREKACYLEFRGGLYGNNQMEIEGGVQEMDTGINTFSEYTMSLGELLTAVPFFIYEKTEIKWRIIYYEHMTKS